MEKEKNDNAERPRASTAWVLVGLVFGILGLFVALITNKGDGRVGKALAGCVIWLPIAAFGSLIILALLGPVVENELGNIIGTLSPTITPLP